jgi:hypothetical protein
MRDLLDDWAVVLVTSCEWRRSKHGHVLSCNGVNIHIFTLVTTDMFADRTILRYWEYVNKFIKMDLSNVIHKIYINLILTYTPYASSVVYFEVFRLRMCKHFSSSVCTARPAHLIRTTDTSVSTYTSAKPSSSYNQIRTVPEKCR